MMEQERLVDALALAQEAHATQKRKGTHVPYISHPMAVAALVMEFGGSVEQAVAALLHDTIEDGGAEYDNRIGELFGPAVRDMVRDCSDATAENKAALTSPEARLADWRARKEAYIEHLAAKPASAPALLVSACDKLHNARAIATDLARVGPGVFARFTAGREGTLWYYDQLVAVFGGHAVVPAPSLAQTVARMHQLAD